MQRKNCDLAKATSLIQSTIETLEKYRQQAGWDHLFSYSKEVAEQYNIPVHNIIKKRQTRTPRHFEEHVLLEPTGLAGCYSRQLKILSWEPLNQVDTGVEETAISAQTYQRLGKVALQEQWRSQP